MSTTLPARPEILALFRALLKTSSTFKDYNIRQYAKRRTIDAFKHNKSLNDPSAITAAFNDGKAQLGIAKRQAIVYSLYASDIKSVMEING